MVHSFLSIAFFLLLFLLPFVLFSNVQLWVCAWFIRGFFSHRFKVSLRLKWNDSLLKKKNFFVKFKVSWWSRGFQNSAVQWQVCIIFISNVSILQIFMAKSAMQMHARDAHRSETKPHQCQQCLKSFSSNHQLVQHIRVHTGEKPYRCSYCDRRFKQLSHVQQHTRLHTGKPLFLFIFFLSYFFTKPVDTLRLYSTWQ